MLKTITLFVAFAFIALTASAQTTTTLTPVKDNSVYSDQTNNSNGLGHLFAGTSCLSSARRALMKFDLSSIPSNAVIISVTLTVNVNQASSSAGNDNHELFPLVQDWGEGSSLSVPGGSGTTAIAPDVTWNTPTTGSGTTWINPNGGGDYASPAVASVTMAPTIGSYTFLSTADFVNTAQGWLQNPALNHGLIMLGTEVGSCNARRFDSKDLGSAPPQLTITWECGPISSTDTQEACDSFTWTNGVTYTSSNSTATDTFTTAAGCDSIVTLDLTINTIDTAVTTSGNTITATQSGATYQWVDCNTNLAISGETNASFTATTDGDYAVIIVANNCVDTSACVNLVNVGVQKYLGQQLVQAYPNPTTGDFYIDLGVMHETVSITVYDLSGKIISNQQYNSSNLIQVQLEEAGMYFVELKSKEHLTTFKVVRQ